MFALSITAFSLGIYATSSINNLNIPAPNPRTGQLWRGYGESITTDPTVVSTCNVYNENNELIGNIVSQLVDGNTNIKHTWTLNDGRVFSFKSSVLTDWMTSVHPVSSNVVTAFPEFAPYFNNSDYAVAFGEATHFATGDPSILEWTITAPAGDWLNNAAKMEVRCVFLLYQGKIIGCRGCMWYISTAV